MKALTLERYEWDFSTCLDQEKDVCLHYEYARQFLEERPALKDEWVGKHRKKNVLHFLTFQCSKRKRRCDGLPILCDQFPALPWLKLSREERVRLLELRDRQLLEESGSELLASNHWELQCLENFAEMQQRHYESWRQVAMQWLETNGQVNGKRVPFAKILSSCPVAALTPRHFYAYTGHINYALIVLDWSKDNSELKRAFERLLKRRPVDYPGPSEAAKQRINTPRISQARGGRGGPFDRLRQLAAMRLLLHWRSSEKTVDFLSDNETYLPYRNVRNVEGAARKARVALGEMEQDGQFWVFSEFKTNH